MANEPGVIDESIMETSPGFSSSSSTAPRVIRRICMVTDSNWLIDSGFSCPHSVCIVCLNSIYPLNVLSGALSWFKVPLKTSMLYNGNETANSIRKVSKFVGKSITSSL